METIRSANKCQWQRSTSENVSGVAHSVSEVICDLINIGRVPRKLEHLSKLNTNDLQFVGPSILLGPDNLGTFNVLELLKSTSARCAAQLKLDPPPPLP